MCSMQLFMTMIKSFAIEINLNQSIQNQSPLIPTAWNTIMTDIAKLCKTNQTLEMSSMIHYHRHIVDEKDDKKKTLSQPGLRKSKI